MVLLENLPLATFYVTPAKVPFAGSHAYLDATADPVQLAKLAAQFRGPKLVAVATGAISGIDIVDIDPRNGGDRWLFEHHDQLPKTRVHETRGGGWHLVFKHSPSLCNSNKLAHGVEFLSTGRWAVWWPEHAGRVLCPGPVAPLPGWLHEALAEPGEMATTPQKQVHPLIPKSGSVPKSVQTTGSVTLRSKTLILDLERTPVGNRHKMLHWVACRFGNMIGEGRMTNEVAECLLVGAAKSNGLWRERPDNCLQTIRDGLRKGRDQWVQVRDKRVDCFSG
ncbi:MAG: bifunctional DNA primase/polymerase [Xanthobacteraceae bacterium]